MKRLRSTSGFTYMAVLVMVVIVEILLLGIGQTWETVMKGDREEELLFRGMQYRTAIERWSKPRPGAQAATPLNDLKDLLVDPRSAQKVRYLRKLYLDPMTGKEFVPIRDGRGITGVVSASNEKTLKRDYFPKELVDFAGKEKYSDWKFIYVPGKVTSPVVGAPAVTGAGQTTGTVTPNAPVEPPPSRPSLY